MSQDSRNASTTKAFVPYIPSGTVLPEFSWRAVLIGTVLGAVFGASSLYLVLKVGLTVSASIPVAVISMTLFKMFRVFGAKDASILENNIAQTAGSAGESIAFGVGVTMPAIMILGFDLELIRVALVSVLGALLGILMMIPLRRALIVAQHGKLKYPEGTACAEVLKAGASDESVAASSPEAKAEYQNLVKKQADANRQLRKVRKDLRQEVEALEFRTKLLNIAGMAMVVTGVGIGLAVLRIRKTAAR